MSETRFSDEQAAVKDLVKKAKDAKTAHEALQFSQAACNAANALRTLADMPNR